MFLYLTLDVSCLIDWGDTSAFQVIHHQAGFSMSSLVRIGFRFNFEKIQYFPYTRDGHQPNSRVGDGYQPNSRGLFFHYKDFLLKVG